MNKIIKISIFEKDGKDLERGFYVPPDGWKVISFIMNDNYQIYFLLLEKCKSDFIEDINQITNSELNVY